MRRAAMRTPAPQAAAPLRAVLFAAALGAAAAAMAGQDPSAIRAVAAPAGPAHSITTFGASWSDLLGTGWSDSGAFPSGVSGLNYGTLAFDGNGNGPPWQSSGGCAPAEWICTQPASC